MKKLTLTKETIRDLSKPEMDGVAGASFPQVCPSNQLSHCCNTDTFCCTTFDNC